MSNESTLERSVVNYCKKRGLLCLKLAAPQRGFPDRTILGPDGFVAFIELKTKTGRVSPHQKQWLGILQQMGFRAGVARSIEEVCTIINAE